MALGDDMRFNVAQLLKEGIGARRNYSLDETFEPWPAHMGGRLKAQLHFTLILLVINTELYQVTLKDRLDRARSLRLH